MQFRQFFAANFAAYSCYTYHLLIFSSSHPLFFTSTHVIFSSSHLHICTYHLLILTSSHLHIFPPSFPLALSLSLSFSHLFLLSSLLRPGPFQCRSCYGGVVLQVRGMQKVRVPEAPELLDDVPAHPPRCSYEGARASAGWRCCSFRSRCSHSEGRYGHRGSLCSHRQGRYGHRRAWHGHSQSRYGHRDG